MSVDGCALSLYFPDQDVFRLMAVEAVPSSDYFVAGRELNAQRTALDGCLSISNLLYIATSNRAALQRKARGRGNAVLLRCSLDREQQLHRRARRR